MKTDTQIIKVTVDPDGDTKEIECVPAAFARQLEAECHRAQCERDHWIEQANMWRGRHSDLFMKLNPIQKECEECEGTGQRAFAVNCPEYTPCVDCNGTGKVPLASESQREAAESADEKPDGQAENVTAQTRTPND